MEVDDDEPVLPLRDEFEPEVNEVPGPLPPPVPRPPRRIYREAIEEENLETARRAQPVTVDASAQEYMTPIDLVTLVFYVFLVLSFALLACRTLFRM